MAFSFLGIRLERRGLKWPAASAWTFGSAWMQRSNMFQIFECPSRSLAAFRMNAA